MTEHEFELVRRLRDQTDNGYIGRGGQSVRCAAASLIEISSPFIAKYLNAVLWQSAETLPEKGESERFAVYLAFDDRRVRLADWVSYTKYGGEYHANGTYLGEYAQDGDALYMTEDGFEVRLADDGRWETFSIFDDGTKKRHVVVGWMEAMKPAPTWPDEV